MPAPVSEAALSAQGRAHAYAREHGVLRPLYTFVRLLLIPSCGCGSASTSRAPSTSRRAGCGADCRLARAGSWRSFPRADAWTSRTHWLPSPRCRQACPGGRVPIVPAAITGTSDLRLGPIPKPPAGPGRLPAADCERHRGGGRAHRGCGQTGLASGPRRIRSPARHPRRGRGCTGGDRDRGAGRPAAAQGRRRASRARQARAPRPAAQEGATAAKATTPRPAASPGASLEQVTLDGGRSSQREHVKRRLVGTERGVASHLGVVERANRHAR